ncbi:MAG: orotate phosphoribosyltransferase [Thaumarchaeota archaeon]|nr:orotate phosphoribosyltransferase [Nitrososphaerota archaeon]MBI3642460.1 orotate phosphoribosyltransferase [Nitrososphaerota archaeon]
MMELVNSKQRELLFNLIYDNAFTVTDDLIPLASGIKTNFYFDIKRLTGNPEGIKKSAIMLYDEIMKIGNVGSVGGLESGAIPIATAVSHYSSETQKPIYSFYVRKEPKTIGLSKWIEGRIESPVVVVEDVITTGESAIKAINIIRNEKYEVEYLFSMVFRGNEETRRKIEEKGKIKFNYIFDAKPFKERWQKEHPEVPLQEITNH